MTDAQNAIWFAAQSGSVPLQALVEARVLDLEGPFDLTTFRRAVQEVVNRHDSLRATFGAAGDVMIVQPEVTLDIPLTDLSGPPDPDTDAILDEEARAPFDLTTGPLIRIRVVKLRERRHRVHLCAHRITCDRWSVVVLVRELAAAYTALALGSRAELPPPPSPRACARDLGEGTAGANRRPIGDAPPLALPADRPRASGRSHARGAVTVTLGEDLAAAVRDAAGRRGLARDEWLLAAFVALLHRLSGQTDVAVGVASPGLLRRAEADLVGPYDGLRPVRVSVEPYRPFRDLVEAVELAALDSLENGPPPAPGPNQELGRSPALPVMFAVEPAAGPLAFGEAVAWLARPPRRFIHHDLQVTLTDTGRDCVAEFAYDAELFDRTTAERWAGHYRTLLAATVADPDTAVGRLTLLTPPEFEQLVTTFNDTAADYPRERRPHELVAERAARDPDRAAVESRGESLTYAELDARANRLAHHLRELGVGPDVPVGLCVRRSVEMVVAMLAVWKAGGAYVPLDPDFPPARLELYLRDSGAPVVVAQADLRDRLPAGAARVVDLDADRATITARPAGPPPDVGSAADLAYLIYTSGSTGTPNGVEVGHRALVNLLTSLRREPGLRPDDVVAAVSTISFDIHHVDLWLPLVTGARVAVLTREDATDPARLAAELDRVGATVLQATPATWRMLLAADWPGRQGLKALSGGEALAPAVAAELLGRVGEVWNMYGPTETAVYSVIHRVEQSGATVPIGRPVANTSLYVLDRLRQPVPIGCVGELYIGGDGLARGYHNRTELTAARFVPDPFRPGERVYKTGDLCRLRPGGVVECLGRIDHQVKVRGHRIELGEVESALASHPSVAAAAVRAWGEPPELAAYVVPRPGATRAPEPIRLHLRALLPGYMVPALVTFVDGLPLTPGGKIDRRALPDPIPSAASRTSVPPRTDAERAVLGVWGEVFGRSGFGVTDDFFALGGTSLQAAEVVTRLGRLGHAVELGAMYDARTVEKLAALVEHGLEHASSGSLVPLQTGGTRPPLFVIAGIGGHVFTLHKFARRLGAEYPVYGLKAIGVDGDRTAPETFEEVAAEYVKEITAAQPAGPYLLSGYSIGAHVAVEVGLQLRALGHEVPLLVVFDMPAPGWPPPLSLPRRLALHARNLFRRDVGGLRYVAQLFRNLGGRVVRLLGRERWLYERPAALDGPAAESLRNVWVALERARWRYWPRGRLAGNIVLFRSETPLDAWSLIAHPDPYLGWADRTDGPVEVRTVAGHHLEMFHDGNLGWLARQVSAAIDRASDGGGPDPRAVAVSPGTASPAWQPSAG